MLTKCSIWYISKYITLPSGGGPGSRGFYIMRELSALGHNCTLITSDSNHLTATPKFNGEYLIEQKSGVTVVWIRTIKYSTAKSLKRVLSWLHFEWGLFRAPTKTLSSPDVVIVSSLSLLTILNGLFLRWRFKCRLVFEIRDIWPLTIVAEGGFCRWNPLVLLLGFIEKLGYKRADVVVGTMPNLGEHVAKVLSVPRRVHCIPMGVDESLISATDKLPDGFESRYFPSDRFTVIHAGTIGTTNALTTLFDCATVLHDRHNIQFLLIGSGALEGQFKVEYAHLTNITFAPRVSRGVLQAVLKRGDLLFLSVFDSLVWKYGQSLNKIVDYMASGRPIVASYSGYRSMINEADCGSFVPAGDHESLVREILKYRRMSAEDLNSIGKRGRRWLLKHRRYPALAKQYLSLIDGGGADSQ